MAKPIAEQQDALNRLCDRIAPKRNQRGAGQGDRWSTGLTDEQVISKAMGGKRGKEFAALYFGDDLSAYGGDHSAADIALVAYIGYWTGPNPEQIDRIFRQSKLFRPKWDERRNEGTYGSLTIDRQLAQQTHYHRPNGRAARDRFTILTAVDLLTRPDPQHLIGRVLVKGSIAALIGEPASFKSFNRI